MELLLNVTWLLIACASFGWWRRRIADAGRGARPNLQALCPLLALVCALAILFPVISVTDDLHREPAVIDESSALRRNVTSIQGSHNHSGPGTLAFHLALLSAPSPALVGNIIAERLSINNFLPQAGGSARISSDRAPPVI